MQTQLSSNNMSLKVIATIVVLLVHLESPEGHWLPHWPTHPNPICSNQYALVNRACLAVQFMKKPRLPSPGDKDGELVSVQHRRRRGRGRGHHHRGHRRSARHGEETPAEEECCRWLKEVDSICACDLLVHLPLFLTRPEHSYTVVVDDSCSVTFRCGSARK